MGEHANIVGMMFRCNADAALSITYADEGARIVCGYTPAELVDTGLISLPDLIHPEDREYVRKTIQEGLNDKRSFVIQTRLHVKGRTPTEGILIGSGAFRGPLSLSGLEGYIIRTISTPVSTNTDGVPSRETCLELLSHAEEVIALLSPEGQISYVTPSVSQIMGYNQGSITGLLFTQLLPENEQKRFDEFKTQVLAGGGSSARFHISLPEGQVRTVFIRLFQPGGMKGMILSATRPDEQMDMPISKESLYQDLFFRIPIPAIITNASDLRIEEMNHAASAYASSFSQAGQMTGAYLRETSLISSDVIDHVREGLGIADQVELPDTKAGYDPVRIIAREIQSGEKDLIIWTLTPEPETIEQPIPEPLPESREFRHTYISQLQMVRKILAQKYLSLSDEPEHDLRYGKVLLDSVIQLYEAGGGKGTGIVICKYLRLITDSITDDFPEELVDIEIVVSCPIDDTVPEKQASILGIITSELILNAIRHAFTPGHAGRIELSLRREEDWYIFQVQDSGRGLPDSVIRTGSATSGFTIIENLAMELSGTMTLANDGGAVVRVIFPAAYRRGS